jgi:hypothetical protein
MEISGDPLSLAGDLGTTLEDIDGILRLAEPWLVDAGLVIPAQTLDGSYKTSTELAREAIHAYLFARQGFIGQMLCDRFDYCQLKQRYKKRADLVKATADALCTFLTGIPIPMILIAAYIVEDGYCDRLCGCTEAL